jgi:hypothetical protein
VAATPEDAIIIPPTEDFTLRIGNEDWILTGGLRFCLITSDDPLSLRDITFIVVAFAGSGFLDCSDALERMGMNA